MFFLTVEDFYANAIYNTLILTIYGIYFYIILTSLCLLRIMIEYVPNLSQCDLWEEGLRLLTQTLQSVEKMYGLRGISSVISKVIFGISPLYIISNGSGKSTRKQYMKKYKAKKKKKKKKEKRSLQRKKQNYNDNKESILNKRKQYHEDNRESVLEKKKKQYREDNSSSVCNFGMDDQQ